MDLTEKEKSILQRIVSDDAFELLQRIASSMLVNWNKNPINRESEWTAASDAVAREERKMALTSFMQTIEKLSHND